MKTAENMLVLESPLFMTDMFQVIRTYIHTYIPMLKFNLQIRHSSSLKS